MAQMQFLELCLNASGGSLLWGVGKMGLFLKEVYIFGKRKMMPPASLGVIKLMHALGSWAVLSALHPHHQIYTSLSCSLSAFD